MTVSGEQLDYIKEELGYAGADQAIAVLTGVMNED